MSLPCWAEFYIFPHVSHFELVRLATLSAMVNVLRGANRPNFFSVYFQGEQACQWEARLVMWKLKTSLKLGCGRKEGYILIWDIENLAFFCFAKTSLKETKSSRIKMAQNCQIKKRILVSVCPRDSFVKHNFIND